MQSPIHRFLLRWLVSSLGLWIAAALLSSVSFSGSVGVIIVAGLLLALINTIIKPILVVLSLPAIIFTLGLFMIVLNGVTVLLVSKLYSSLQVTNLWAAMLAGMVIGLVNYLVTTVIEDI